VGVSPSTVCRALNGRGQINADTRQKIIAASERLGYVRNAAASNLRLKRLDAVACLMPDGDNELHIDKLHLLKRHIVEAGYRWVHGPYRGPEERDVLLGNIVASRPAGLVIHGDLGKPQRDVLHARSVPTVFYDDDVPGFDSVVLDRAHGVEKAVRFLLDKGRRRVLLLGSKLASDRGRGYAAAHEARRVSIDPALAVDEPFGRDLYAYGYEQARSAMPRTEFDAIACVNDACAIGAMRALHEAGRVVPDEVSIVGFDNIMASAYTTPTLSTVAQPIDDMARQAVSLLVARMAKPEAKRRRVRLATTFLARESA
jgi:DNA-binding LacI/PurR family transcriptional regulator